jgi:hypothetical protein
MNKKYLLAFGAFLLIVSVVFLVSHKTTQQGSSQKQITSQTSMPLSPVNIAKNFYSWYISYPNNPISSKEFQNSPYLTTSFKQQSEDFNDPADKYDPVFCKQNQMAHVAYQQKANPPFTDVIIHQDTIQEEDLYRVVFAHIKGQWLITDIICIR